MAMEKRACRRFEVPGAMIRIRRAGFFGRLFGFSEPLMLLNLSKGGAGIETDAVFRVGQKVVVQLVLPEEPPLRLWGEIRWQATIGFNNTMMTGVQFLPFADHSKLNSLDSLKILERLEKTYAEEQQSRLEDHEPGEGDIKPNIDELL